MVAKLKLGALADDKPVKLTISLPAALWADLVKYAEVLGRQTDQVIEPAKLVAPMLGSRFMATGDRTFTKVRRQTRGRGTSFARREQRIAFL